MDEEPELGLIERWSMTEGALRRGVGFALLAGLAWALFLLGLGHAGEEPSGPLILPIPRASYYQVEAALVIPVRLLAVTLFAGVAHRLLGQRGEEGAFGAAFAIVALAAEGSALLFWLLPDVVAYASGGFDLLGAVVRAAAPTTAVATLAFATRSFRRVFEVSPGRAFGAALAGFVVAGVLSGLVLR